MLKEAELFRSLKNNVVQCRVCEHYCTLQLDAWGKCGVRVNRDGTLFLAVYGDAVAAHVDPIEKKPLFHVLPGSQALSIGTYGCNLRCRWWQNWQLSQVKQGDIQYVAAKNHLDYSWCEAAFQKVLSQGKKGFEDVLEAEYLDWE